MNKPRQNPQSIAHGVKNYHWVMFRHAMEFVKQHASLKKPLLEHYFTSLLKDLSNENSVALCELLTI
jgi:hypothetical protein